MEAEKDSRQTSVVAYTKFTILFRKVLGTGMALRSVEKLPHGSPENG